MSIIESNKSQAKFKRTTLLINRNFQIKFILKVLFPMVAVIIMFSGIGLWQISILQKTFHFNSFNEMIIKLSPHMGRIGSDSQAIFSFLNNILLYGGIILFVLATLYVGWIFLLFSHRIAGPIFRFEKAFERVAQGDLTELIYLRKKDEFKDMAQKFNNSIYIVKDKITELAKHQTELNNILSNIKEQGKGASPEDIGKILKIQESIKEIMDGFRF